MPAPGATTFWLDDPAPVDALRLRRAPLLAAACAFALGTLLPHTQLTVILFTTCGLLLFLSLLALKSTLRLAPIPIFALWLAAGCWCAQIQPNPPPQTALKTYADGLSRTVRGRIVRIRQLPAKPSPPPSDGEATKPWQTDPGAWETEDLAPTESIDLAVTEIEDLTPDTSTLRPITGGIRVTILDGHPNLACGDTLELPLRLREPDTYRDAGAQSYADLLLTEGISLHASIKASKITIVPPPQPSTNNQQPTCRLYAAQTWAATQLPAFLHTHAAHIFPRAATLNQDDTAMLNAMLFGDRTGLRHDLRLGFERTGVFHLFVVSGMHVALLAGMAFFLLRKLRASHGWATVLTLAATTAYALLTGFGVPVQRALLMTAVFLTARWLWRDIDILQAIGAAALTVLVVSTRALTEASFQMTFLALIAVGGLAIPLAERTFLPTLRATKNLDALYLDVRLPPHLAQLRIMLRLFGRALAATPFPLPKTAKRALPAFILRTLLRLLELATVAIVVEACMAVPMAVFFHRATPFALPANLLSVPLIAILAPLVVLTFVTSLISSWLAAIPAAATALILHGVTQLIALLSHASLADTRVPAPSPTVLAAIVCTLAFACWAIRQRSCISLAFALIAIAAIPTAALWPEKPLLHPNTLEVTALDVGQGDSLLVVSPQGRTLLIDAGGPVGFLSQASNPEKWDVGEEVVAPYLWSRRLRTLDTVLLTHAHSDHMGGLPAILRDFHPRELWLSIDPADSPDFRALLTLAAELHITIRHFQAGDTFPLDTQTQATILAPEPNYTNLSTPTNNDSLVLRLDYGQSSVLLEGDAERPSESAMLANHRLAPVTLLKVGHHGSRTSTNPDFLTAITPHTAVISDGRHNTFGHPRYEILERLETLHTQTFRTDRQGATTFLLTPDGHLTTQSAAQ